MPDTYFKAAICDLDGVITQTASLHAQAWKKMFDMYNDRRKKDQQNPFGVFSIEHDYPKYIDGIPRYDGVYNFLESRNIKLPKGEESDEPGKESICGLGNWKNDLFLEMIDSKGVKIKRKNVEKVREWKKNGFRTAIISSSRNCKKILKVAGLEGLFDVRVDGMVSSERNLKGKPEPDIFLSAAGDLGLAPDECIVIEDSLAGVNAGKKGKFGLIIGIAHGNKVLKMKESGADKVVQNLSELALSVKPLVRAAGELPDALKYFDRIVTGLKPAGKEATVHPFLFLDYDGTLTPIVEKYEKADLSNEMRDVLKEVSKYCITAVVSGRGMPDVKRRVDLDHLYYAGSHGYEMSGPGNFSHEVAEASKLIPVLDKAENELRENLKSIRGVRFERKKFALAIHYRQVREDEEHKVKKHIDQILKNIDELSEGKGKKVIEVKPDLYWHKGKAVNHLVSILTEDDPESAILYIGDDITDEDAFMQIRNGAGILVGDHHEKSFAGYHLDDVDAVRSFLLKLIAYCKN